MNRKTITSVLALAALWAAPALAAPRPAQGEEDPGKTFQKLSEEFDAAFEDYRGKLDELTEKGATKAELAEFRASWDPTPYYADLMMEHARANAGTEAALDPLLWVVRNPAGAPDEPVPEVVNESLDILLADHGESPELQSELTFAHYWAYDVGRDRALAVLDRVVAKGTGAVADAATFSRARVVFDQEGSSDAEKKAARASLDALADAGGALASQVQGLLFELDHLQVGMVAPDIEAADLEGVTFKLSDYRGKVVMLDFWGDW